MSAAFQEELDKMMANSQISKDAIAAKEKADLQKKESELDNIPTRWVEVKALVSELVSAVNVKSSKLGFSADCSDISAHKSNLALIINWHAVSFAPSNPWRLEVDHRGIATLYDNIGWQGGFGSLTDAHIRNSILAAIANVYKNIDRQKEARGLT